MKHIRGFDVLRSVAVLSVMVYHLGYFGYGWLGVPFFFVLSGFLITGILVDNREAGGSNYFSTFYFRRCLRIFPVYYLYIAVVFAWCIWGGVNYEGWSYFIFYLQNYSLGSNGLSLPPGVPLGHTWSLAVEEQFYLIWPIVVYFASSKQLKVISLVLIFVTIASRYWIVNNSTHVVFTPLTSNFDTLCIGALLALAYRESAVKLRNLSYAMLALGVVVLVITRYLPGTSLNSSDGGFTLFTALLFGSIVGLVASGAVPMFQSKILSYIGKISYGLYIWHAFTYMLINSAIYNKWIPDYGSVWMNVIRVALTFAVAIPSYHLFELPLLRLKDRFNYKRSIQPNKMDRAAA